MSSNSDFPVKGPDGRYQNVDLSKAAGFEHPSLRCSYNRRDVLLFANAIGATRDERHFLYELDSNFAAFPTFPINLAFKQTDQDVFDFLGKVKGAPLPGVPPLDPQRSVDGERGIEVIRPVPVDSKGLDLEIRGRTVGVYDKGKNLVIKNESLLVDAKTDTVYTKMTNSGVGMGQGGYNGPRGPDEVPVAIPKRQPDVVCTSPTSPEVAFLYRLCGDYNPLHADDDFGKRAGFKGHILQGLGTWNITAHEVLKAMGGSDPARFKSFNARFKNVVYPGDVLETRIWKEGKVGNFDRLIFETLVKSDGRVALSNGTALIKCQDSPRL